VTVTVRYPGRICLLGEHCDWAGGASLVVPLPLTVRVVCDPAPDGLIVESNLDGELLGQQWPTQGVVDRAGGPLRFVAAAAQALVQRGIAMRPAHLHIDADLPAGRGFSSSAAVTLATLDALCRHVGQTLGPADLADLAFVVEHDLLGVQCGRLDPIACAAGQPSWIRWLPGPKGQVSPKAQPIRPGGRFHLVAACFPYSRDTPGILSTLQDAWIGDLRDALQASRARAVYTAITAFGDVAAVGARAMMAGDAKALGACLDVAQQVYENHLADAFVALRAPALWRACQALRSHGALGAKFSGAGGDGSVIALLPDQPSALAAIDLLEVRGLPAWYCPFGKENP